MFGLVVDMFFFAYLLVYLRVSSIYSMESINAERSMFVHSPSNNPILQLVVIAERLGLGGSQRRGGQSLALLAAVEESGGRALDVAMCDGYAVFNLKIFFFKLLTTFN